MVLLVLFRSRAFSMLVNLWPEDEVAEEAEEEDEEEIDAEEGKRPAELIACDGNGGGGGKLKILSPWPRP